MLYKDLRILYSHEKGKLSNWQWWEIWKETAFIELCSFFIDPLAFKLGKLCPGGGDFCFVFSTRGPEFCTEKLSRGWGFWRKKLVAPRSAWGGTELVPFVCHVAHLQFSALSLEIEFNTVRFINLIFRIIDNDASFQDILDRRRWLARLQNHSETEGHPGPFDH